MVERKFFLLELGRKTGVIDGEVGASGICRGAFPFVADLMDL